MGSKRKVDCLIPAPRKRIKASPNVDMNTSIDIDTSAIIKINSSAQSNNKEHTMPQTLHYARGEIIKVQVGTPAVTFHVHKLLLAEKAKYFRGALENKFEEAMRGEVELKSDDPATFDLFISWLYSGKISSDVKVEDPTIYTRLWILADMLCIEDKTLQFSALQKLLACVAGRANTLEEVVKWIMPALELFDPEQCELLEDVAKGFSLQLRDYFQEMISTTNPSWMQLMVDYPKMATMFIRGAVPD